MQGSNCLIAALIVGLLVSGCGQRDAGGPQPLLVFGRTGMGAGEFSYPRAAAASPDRERVYIVDKAARVQCYTPEGQFLFDWHMPDAQAGKPTGLGVGPDGKVYVADTHYSRVIVFDPQGHELARFGTFGEGPGQFKLPSDVAIDQDGSIYVSEYGGNDRISEFTADYQYVLSFGGNDAGEARLERPQSLLVGPDKSLWVSDACNHRICRFDRDGKLLASFGVSGDALGELKFPYGMDMLSDGTLVVTEYGNNRIQRFDTSGRSLGTWGVAGRKPGELAYPWAAVVVKDDRIMVIDSGNNRVQVINGQARGTWRQQ